MILVVGDPSDPVIERVISELGRQGVLFAFIDETAAPRYKIELCDREGRWRWRILGGDCVGRRAVGAIFVRHALRPAKTVFAKALRALCRRIDSLLSSTTCRVVNRPSCAFTNYSKPYQLRQLAEAGFLIPRTLVTNIPKEALRFIASLHGRVLFKGISSLKTAPQLVTRQHVERLSLLQRCPTQFQEFISGADVRVTVVGESAEAVGIVAGLPRHDFNANALLGPDVLERCTRFTVEQGLVMSGMDLRVTEDGRAYAFELNPYPLFTHYEPPDDPRITRRVVDYLVKYQDTSGNIRV